jgi:hypothetical protein
MLKDDCSNAKAPLLAHLEAAITGLSALISFRE